MIDYDGDGAVRDHDDYCDPDGGADDWAALFAAGFIVYNSYLIFRPALGEVMDEHLYDDLIEEIRQVSIHVDGVLGTEKCFVRKAGTKYHVDLHALVNGDITVYEGHAISHKLKDTLIRKIPNLEHVLIHIEPKSHTSNISRTNSNKTY